jgi:hypothetical protein
MKLFLPFFRPLGFASRSNWRRYLAFAYSIWTPLSLTLNDMAWSHLPFE